MVRRTDMPRIVTNDTQLTEKKIPAALNLPFGKLFFGYEVIPVGGKQDEAAKAKRLAGICEVPRMEHALQRAK